ncbi:MAG: TraB/GumN family protein [Rubrivivax sp.]|jgi:uncharacterized protein YbaP (TraB family)|nr:TraB/GumN family protein [Rubrivivax sp.]
MNTDLTRHLHRWLSAGALLLGCGLGWAQGSTSTAASCPPVAQRPSAEQLDAARAAARDRGLLWRISKGGRSSYLYGTIHLGKLEWAFPGPGIERALAEVQAVVLELDTSDPATLTKLQRAMARKPDTPALPAALRQGLAKETQAACLPAQALADQLPAVQALSLTLLAARWDGLDASFAQELTLAQVAQARGLPLLALETVDEQMAALLPATPAESERFVAQALAQLRNGAARRGAVRLTEAWAQGRLEDLANYAQWCDCVNTEEESQMLRRLNDDRNPAMASRIDRLHAQRSLFVGVGALHMTGPKALTDLLRQRGFEVERVRLEH